MSGLDNRGMKGHEDSACPDKAHAAYSKWIRDVALSWLCVWIHVCEGVHVHTVEAKSLPWVLLLRHRFLRQIPYWEMEITNSAWLSGWWPSRIFMAYSPALGLQMHMTTPALYMDAGHWTQVLTVLVCALYQLNHLLSSCSLFSMMRWLNKIG